MSDERKTAAEKSSTKDVEVKDKKVESTEEMKTLGKAAEPKGDHVSVGGPADEVGEYEVHVVNSDLTPEVDEVYVVTDKVVHDPTGPLGVQIPSVLMTDVSLPIHALAMGTPEQQLADGDDSE